MESRQYPIGKFQPPSTFHNEDLKGWIEDIKNLPDILIKSLENAQEHQLNSTYRDGGWTIKQVVHHIADSHMNSFIRFKLALTENSPVIKAYDETAWAELLDSNINIDSSLQIIKGVHERWTVLLHSLDDTDFRKTIIHPENGEMSLYTLLAQYSWHSKHHTSHIQIGLNK